MMGQKKARVTWFWGITLLTVLLAATWSQAAVEKMTKEDLKTKLGSADVVVVDMRLGKDWKASESKIKGAVRVEADAVETLATTYTKDKTLVFYCA
ncbi:MAG: hypothetical protein FJZ47_13795 [Candidatus Tectomicrobia bacterium]|uniref:Rhodanese domain-containing protein n=1 Tax=Tectimicrobiota bacterium TaxID=2528274 RepID=A0A937W459_UNCTE|nr:hypothetical protein [Candidatus Tectomicrobia bacterium]